MREEKIKPKTVIKNNRKYFFFNEKEPLYLMKIASMFLICIQEDGHNVYKLQSPFTDDPKYLQDPKYILKMKMQSLGSKTNIKSLYYIGYIILK